LSIIISKNDKKGKMGHPIGQDGKMYINKLIMEIGVIS